MNSGVPFAPSSFMPSSGSGSGQSQKSASDKIVIVPQTKLAFIGYVLLLIVMLMRLVQGPMDVSFIAAGIVWLIMAVVSLYGINCAVLGRCNLYAWICAFILVIFGFMGVLGLMMSLSK